jgi:hypothetical protein
MNKISFDGGRLPLIESSMYQFSVHLSERVVSEIRDLHQKFKNLEWSGIIFYTQEGEGNLDNPEIPMHFDVKYILPLNLGVSTYTGFRMDSSKIAKAVAQFESDMDDEGVNLFGVNRGLIHTHHSMSTYFSGEDNDELATSSQAHLKYLSVITNHKEDHIAALAIPTKLQIGSISKSVVLKVMGEVSASSPSTGSKAFENARDRLTSPPQEGIRLTNRFTTDYRENIQELIPDVFQNFSQDLEPGLVGDEQEEEEKVVVTKLNLDVKSHAGLKDYPNRFANKKLTFKLVDELNLTYHLHKSEWESKVKQVTNNLMLVNGLYCRFDCLFNAFEHAIHVKQLDKFKSFLTKLLEAQNEVVLESIENEKHKAATPKHTDPVVYRNEPLVSMSRGSYTPPSNAGSEDI